MAEGLREGSGPPGPQSPPWWLLSVRAGCLGVTGRSLPAQPLSHGRVCPWQQDLPWLALQIHTVVGTRGYLQGAYLHHDRVWWAKETHPGAGANTASPVALTRQVCTRIRPPSSQLVAFPCRNTWGKEEKPALRELPLKPSPTTAQTHEEGAGVCEDILALLAFKLMGWWWGVDRMCKSFKIEQGRGSAWGCWWSRDWDPGCQHHPNKGRIYSLSLFPSPKEAAHPLLVQSRAGNHRLD